MKLYLAGPIANCTDAECNDWRARVKALHPDCLDPLVRDGRHLSLTPDECRMIVEGDKADISSCDALLVWYVKPTVGTSMEILYAWERHKPVIVVNVENAQLSPWITYHATGIVVTIEHALSVARKLGAAYSRPTIAGMTGIACCANERRNFSGSCESCGDPCL